MGAHRHQEHPAVGAEQPAAVGVVLDHLGVGVQVLHECAEGIVGRIPLPSHQVSLPADHELLDARQHLEDVLLLAVLGLAGCAVAKGVADAGRHPAHPLSGEQRAQGLGVLFDLVDLIGEFLGVDEEEGVGPEEVDLHPLGGLGEPLGQLLHHLAHHHRRILERRWILALQHHEQEVHVAEVVVDVVEALPLGRVVRQ